uniref:Putative secreted protein n=1 Tax=Ixodes ricinus TaxID=34613 RepID=A0A6B0UU58_IXORI
MPLHRIVAVASASSVIPSLLPAAQATNGPSHQKRPRASSSNAVSATTSPRTSMEWSATWFTMRRDDSSSAGTVPCFLQVGELPARRKSAAYWKPQPTISSNAVCAPSSLGISVKCSITSSFIVMNDLSASNVQHPFPKQKT